MRALAESDGVVWFPVRHHSPACAWHVQQLIRRLQPAAVLVEGPDDATPLIPALVDASTEPPVSILSTWVDKKDVHGLNGVLTPSPDVPVRYRAWWPFVPYSPELIALVEGSRCGAELGFIDAPLPATLPFTHARQQSVTAVVSDRNLAEGAYFEALARTQRRRSFAELWEASFEVDGLQLDTDAFLRRLWTFAWCTRHVAGAEALEEDGTLLREAHMRWHVDQVRKRHTGWIVVVTGAFHSVALGSTKGRRAKAKADRDTTTLLCAHSFPALARLSDQNRLPAYGQAVWDAACRGEPRPHGTAAMELLTHVMRAARSEGQPVSTADAAGAWAVAERLADLRHQGVRGRPSPTRFDLLDACEMAYVKGEAGRAGQAFAAVARRVLVGTALGRVSEVAGQPPLFSAYYQACKEHRLDVSGVRKTVRCDIGRQPKHRLKSAFLHTCDLLDVPMFAPLDSGWGNKAHFRGPDPTTGTDLHLLGETWGVQWSEDVDGCLVELADRGTTLAEVAGSVLSDALDAAHTDVGEATRLLLQTGRMMLLEHVGRALDVVEDALRTDRRFLSLTRALGELQRVLGLQEGVPPDAVERTRDVLLRTWEAAVLELPGLAHVEASTVRAHVDGLQDLVRLGLGFDDRPLDLRLLGDRLEGLAAHHDGSPAIRGAALGVLFSLGRRREAEIARALEQLLQGTGAREAGPFLEGLFTTGRGALLGGHRLLDAVDRVLGALDWAEFRALLPDLRRAFTSFTPRELDTLGSRVAARVGLTEPPDPDRPVPDELVTLVSAADARAVERLASWGLPWGT